MKVIKLLILILFLFFYLFEANNIFAQQGCCSWHGGIDYCDTSVGRYVCNDGEYSPSCGCTYIPKVLTPTPIPLPLPPPAFPKEINAEWVFKARPNKTYDIEIKLNDGQPTEYSAVIGKYIGVDPGSLIDFHKPEFTFYNVPSGKWYVNVKKLINNTWSTVAYWTIIVPEWASPTPTTIPTSTPTLDIDASTNNKSSISSFFEWLFGLGKSKNNTTPVPTPTLKPSSQEPPKASSIWVMGEKGSLKSYGFSTLDVNKDGKSEIFYFPKSASWFSTTYIFTLVIDEKTRMPTFKPFCKHCSFDYWNKMASPLDINNDGIYEMETLVQDDKSNKLLREVYYYENGDYVKKESKEFIVPTKTERRKL